jgi:hypothetical protein
MGILGAGAAADGWVLVRVQVSRCKWPVGSTPGSLPSKCLAPQVCSRIHFLGSLLPLPEFSMHPSPRLACLLIALLEQGAEKAAPSFDLEGK